VWTPRKRAKTTNTLVDPVIFSELVLIERYNQPDTLSITGRLDDVRALMQEGSGIYLVDDLARPRFSGWATPIERRGDKTGTVTYIGDLTLLWDRFCWPTPANAWTNQTSSYDTQTAVNETRILGYITRNAGSTAYNGGGVDRRVSGLRVPASLGRGSSAVTSARFQNLGQLCADLAEAANLRVRILFTPNEGGSNYFDVFVDDAPDLSSWAQFGDGYASGPGLLAESWRYQVGAGVSMILSAAQGELNARGLNFLQDTTRRSNWGRHIEFFVDQRDTTDATEISEGMTNAMNENAPTVEAEAPIVSGSLTFGPGAGSIPVGAKVAVSLDGQLITERVRQLTTTVSVKDGAATEVTEPLFGTPDAGLTPELKALFRALRRIRTLEVR